MTSWRHARAARRRGRGETPASRHFCEMHLVQPYKSAHAQSNPHAVKKGAQGLPQSARAWSRRKGRPVRTPTPMRRRRLRGTDSDTSSSSVPCDVLYELVDTRIHGRMSHGTLFVEMHFQFASKCTASELTVTMTKCFKGQMRKKTRKKTVRQRAAAAAAVTVARMTAHRDCLRCRQQLPLAVRERHRDGSLRRARGSAHEWPCFSTQFELSRSRVTTVSW